MLRGYLPLLAVVFSGAEVLAQSTAFNYQGRLNSTGAPASGAFDVRFSLFAMNTNGVSLAGPVTNSAVAVSNGLFTGAVDFGAGVFSGGNRWLELAVRTNGSGAFTVLAPRQQITAAPYALYAPNAGRAASVSAANITARSRPRSSRSISPPLPCSTAGARKSHDSRRLHQLHRPRRRDVLHHQRRDPKSAVNARGFFLFALFAAREQIK